MFRPFNTPQQQWPLTTQEHNNLRVSQTPPIQVKFYLPEDEIRRATISTDCTFTRITEQIKSYASVTDKNLLLSWNDDQNDWIDFNSDSEFSEAMNYARHLSLGNVFKIQVKEGKAHVVKKQQPAVLQQPKPVVVQPPVEQPKTVVAQPPIQPIQQPQIVQQPPFNSQPNPPFKQPIQPMVMLFQEEPQPMIAQPSSHQPMIMNTKEAKIPVVKKQQPVLEQPKPIIQPPPILQQPPTSINTPEPNVTFYPQFPVQQQTFKQQPFQPMAMPFQQPQQPMGMNPPMMAKGTSNPMVMNQFQQQQPIMVTQPTTNNIVTGMPAVASVSTTPTPYNTPPTTTTSKTLTNCVTMQQPNPLNNSSFSGSPSMGCSNEY